MNLPFTTEEFLNVFSQYNRAVFPLQIIFNLLALFIVYIIIKKKNFTDRFVSYSLGFLWLWIGIIYQFIFFSEINPAARIFALFFIFQAFIFFYLSIKKKLSFNFRNDWTGVTGIVLIIYALIIYPVLGILFGHIYPQNPTFGLPCPTVIFTFGVLLLTDKKISLYTIIIPFLWSLLGFSAAMNLGIKEDIGLLAAGLVSTGIILFVKTEKVKKQLA